MNIIKFQSIWSLKKRNIISYSIIIISFIFSRLPFFIWSPITGVGNDAFEYFYMSNQFGKGYLPVFDIIPIGLPLVLYVTGLFSGKLMAVSMVQNIFCLASSLFLIRAIAKYYPQKLLIASIFIAIYLMDGLHGSLDSYILPDSLYISSLLLLSGCLIYAFKSNKPLPWIFLALSMILPALIRSNGLYVYLISLFILILLIKQAKYRNLLVFCASFLILNMMWATYNYYSGGVFFISNYNRLLKHYVVKKNINNSTPNTTKRKKTELAKKMFLHFAEVNNSFYYEMPYRCAYMDSMKMNFKQNDALVFDIDDNLKKLVLKEFYYGSGVCNKLEMSNFNSKDLVKKYPNKLKRYYAYFKSTNIWLFLYQLYIKFYQVFIKNMVFLFIGVFCFLLSFAKLLKRGTADIENFLAFTFGFLHFFSILFISFSIGMTIQYPRYVFATEFFIYLNIIFVFNEGTVQNFRSKLTIIYKERSNRQFSLFKKYPA